MAFSEAAFANVMNSFRRMLRGASEEGCLKVFENVCHDLADTVTRNFLDKPKAIDAAYELADSCGLVEKNGNDAIQQIIAHQFDGVEPERVPDDFERAEEWEKQRGKANGKDNGKDTHVPGINIMPENDFIEGFTAPDYLIEGILQRRFIYALTGQTGHAKTAVALLIAELVAGNDPNARLGRYRASKGKVLYLVGENPDDVRMRVIGSLWQHEQDGTPIKCDRWFVPGVFSIKDLVNTIREFLKKIGPVALIVVDTSAAYFLGQDENANPQMGEHARAMRELTTLDGGPCVLVLCHPTKHCQDASQLLPRGGGAFLAEMDGNLTLWRQNENTIELDFTKLRGPAFQPIKFRLVPIENCPRLKDTEQRPLPTVRAEAMTRKQADQADEVVGNNADLVLMAMLKDPERTSQAAIAEAIGWRLKSDEPDARKVGRILHDPLEKQKFVQEVLNKFVLTEKGKERARQMALKKSPQSTQPKANEPEPKAKPKKASDEIEGKGSMQIIGPEPFGTTCELCGKADGQVYRMRNPFESVRSKILHERCGRELFLGEKDAKT